MSKIINEIKFRYIMLRVWLHEKKNGTPFEMCQFGVGCAHESFRDHF